MSDFTHFNKDGEAHMVDVGAKAVTARRAVAEGKIIMQPKTLEGVRVRTHRKGNVLGVARVAAIMAAKKTAELIPLCHVVPINAIDIEFEFLDNGVLCRASVATDAKTGVEMEALVAVQAALLTIYDMCKAVDRGMIVTDIQLLAKTGGQSGSWTRTSNPE